MPESVFSGGVLPGSAVQDDGRGGASLGHTGVSDLPLRFGFRLQGGLRIGNRHQRRFEIGGREPETHCQRGRNEHGVISLIVMLYADSSACRCQRRSDSRGSFLLPWPQGSHNGGEAKSSFVAVCGDVKPRGVSVLD